MECPICNAVCNTRRTLALHLAKQHKDISDIDREYLICNRLFGEDVVAELIKQYQNEEICCNDLITNKTDIVKLLMLLGIKRTNKQEKLTKRYIEKYKSTLIERYGVDNVSKLDAIKQKKVESLAISSGHTDYSSFFKSVKAERHIGQEKFIADKQRIRDRTEKMKATLYERHGVKNPGQLEHVRKINSDNRKAYFMFLSADEKRQFTLKARSVFITGELWCSQIERRIQSLLEKARLPFRTHVFINGYNFDILVGDNLLIEVQGDFWHANPRIYIASDIMLGNKTASDIWDKDLRKKASIQSKYNLLVYWEMDINNMSDDDLYDTLIEDIYNVEFRD